MSPCEDRPVTKREEELAAQYADARNHLIRVAYAVLGTRVEAEDVVGDCWLRLLEADGRGPVRDVAAWATVAVARAALDVLRSARHQRELYVGDWLPAPDLHAVEVGPDQRVSIDESVRYALLVVLETLSPAERVAFVMHDLFGYSFPEIAELVGRTPAAVRQLASRARRHVELRAPRFDIQAAEQRAVVDAFLVAAQGGDLAALVVLLDENVVLTADGGGIVTAARRPVHGRSRVARFLLGTFAQLDDDHDIRQIWVNGERGIALLTRGKLHTVMVLTAPAGAIARVDIVRAPEKLKTAPQD